MPTKSPILKEFDTLLEQMIALQTKEQHLILERQTDFLPATSQSIEWLGLQLESMEKAVRQELQSPSLINPAIIESKIQEKLMQIRRLAQQNRTLLEHSLFFLQKLFQQVLERDTPLPLYSMRGPMLQNDLSGGLLETRV